MCEPTTVFMGISLALTAIGGYTQYESQKAEGRYNEAVAKNNAAAAEAQAKQSEQLGSIDEDRQRARMRQMIGKQRAAFAANNIDSSSGTALDLISETAQFGEEDALAIRANAARDAWGFRTQGMNYRAQGTLARAQARNQGTATLLSTGAQMANTGYNYFGGFGGGGSAAPWSATKTGGNIKSSVGTKSLTKG